MDQDTAGRPVDLAGETDRATFGAGCFWCVEAVLQRFEGVLEVVSGYMGGAVADPTYEHVCTGTSGHAEVVQVCFDRTVRDYATLLDAFWRLHDPTTLNRQGNDCGTQYRSVIFYHDETQRVAAEQSLVVADKSILYRDPIVTEISPASTFYPAEGYHQDYYRRHRDEPYCRFVIAPKLGKMGEGP